MNSEEFLQGLKDALVGKVSDQVIQENISFYRSYITKKMLEGLSEEKVLSELGNPRLIAKTIIQSSSFAENNTKEEEDVFENARNNTGKSQYHKVLHLPGFVVGILLILVMMVVIGLAFCMIRFLGPLIILGLIGVGVYQFIKRYIS